MVSSMSTQILALDALSALVRRVRESHEWVVVIVPPGDAGDPFQRVLTTITPPDGHMGGRTLMLPGGGRVTVTEVLTDVAGDGYLIMFLGFDQALQRSVEIALHYWRNKAVGIVRPGEQAHDLRSI